MSFHQEVMREVLSGSLREPFGRADLVALHPATEDGRIRIGQSSFAPGGIGSLLAGYACRPDGSNRGDYVNRLGAHHWHFDRVAHGKYRLHRSSDGGLSEIPPDVEVDGSVDGIDGQVDVAATDEDTGLQPEFTTSAQVRMASLSEFIVDAISQTPYKRYFRRQRQHYPEVPACGWQARLDAYFWPSLNRGWLDTERVLAALVLEGQALGLGGDSKSLEGAHAGLSSLFQQVCNWGGVKMPNMQSNELWRVVHASLAGLDTGNPQALTTPINSAWTKLYALLRPEIHVIYDSRVATSLICHADRWLDLTKRTELPELYRGLGTVAGRGGSRPRATQRPWPIGYGRWGAQAAANQLCIDVLDALNASEASLGRRWTLREVEAVLFMDGY